MSKAENEILGYLALTDPNINSDLATKDISYDPTGKPNSQRAIDEAKASNDIVVVYPSDRELQIDIDNEHSYLLFTRLINVLGKHVGIINWHENPSKSGQKARRHITVTLSHPVTELERICLQACLGSDRVRELLGYVQYKNNDPHPTLFLEKNFMKVGEAKDEETKSS